MKEFRVTLAVQGPVLTTSSVTQGYGVDAPAARRRSDGRLYLPYSHVRGKVREQAALLGFTELLELFGRPSGNRSNQTGGVEPLRTRVVFTDFVDPVERDSRLRTRISMDEDRGAAREQMVAVLESAYEPGERVEFHGGIRLYATQPERVAKQLTAALRAISSLGSQRSAGFGRVVQVEIEQPSVPAPPPATFTTRTLGLELATSDLVCVAAAQPAENLFQSAQCLPGNALKGALSTTWMLHTGGNPAVGINGNSDPSRRELGEIFERVRIRHARPVKAGIRHRPLQPPLSLLFMGGRWWDSALLPEAPQGWDAVPSFAPDFKKENPGDLFGEVDVPVELRVRTEIDNAMETDKRRARDERLFAYELLSPGQEYRWLTYVDFPEDAPDAAILQFQEVAAGGIDFFGKTKAKLSCTIFEPHDPETQSGTPAQPRDGLYVLALQTPALLNNPALYNYDLQADYRAAWDSLSNGSLVLEDFRARQRLAGGYYQGRRFNPNGFYRPWLLTDAGSVFVLKRAAGQEVRAEECIQEWLHHGLPIPADTATTYGLVRSAADWRSCPYIRENGFGEIAVNLDKHWTLRLKSSRGEA